MGFQCGICWENFHYGSLPWWNNSHDAFTQIGVAFSCGANWRRLDRKSNKNHPSPVPAGPQELWLRFTFCWLPPIPGHGLGANSPDVYWGWGQNNPQCQRFNLWVINLICQFVRRKFFGVWNVQFQLLHAQDVDSIGLDNSADRPAFWEWPWSF